MTTQTGQIEWRSKNSCRLTVQCGLKEDKKQIRKRRTVQVTGRTDAQRKKQAEMALAEFIVDLDRGNVLDSTSTFKEFTGRWWTEYATKKLAPKTQARYKEILDTRVLPAMGHLKIGDIRPMHIIDFLSNIREDGIRLDKKDGCLSEGSVLYHYRMISSILGKAKRWQVILNNPAANVEPPKVEKKKA